MLVELRTPVYKAVLGPVCDAIPVLPDVTLGSTSEYPDRIRPLIGGAPFISHADAEWTRFDLYLNADPWAAARLRRCAHRINFFHGVAGRFQIWIDLPGCRWDQVLDRVAFINRDRMERYLGAGVVTNAQAALVGYPKLDRLASGGVDGRAVRTFARACQATHRLPFTRQRTRPPPRCTSPGNRSSVGSPTPDSA